MRKSILLLFTAFVFLSCEKQDIPVPAYIYVPGFNFQVDAATQGSGSANIKDAWISVDGQLIGSNNLPTLLPVILANGEGDYTVRIGAGIENNGVANMRSIYSFYTRYEAVRHLRPGQIDTILPQIRYESDARIVVLEDFEGPGVAFGEDLDGDTTSFMEKSNVEQFEGNYVGSVVLNDLQMIVGTSARFSNLQPSGTAFPVYLEFDYKNNYPIEVGMISYYANGSTEINYICQVNARDNWNKLYVDLSGITYRNNAAQYGMVFRVLKSNDAEPTRVYFDNIKLLYFN